MHHEFKFTGSGDVRFSIEIVATLLGIETQLVSVKVLSIGYFFKVS